MTVFILITVTSWQSVRDQIPDWDWWLWGRRGKKDLLHSCCSHSEAGTNAGKKGGCLKLRNEDDHEYEDDECSIKKLSKSAIIKTKYDQNLPLVDEYPVIVYATASSNAASTSSLATAHSTLANKREMCSSIV